MKKFFTAIPLQKQGQLHSQLYHPMGNSKLRCEAPIAFPILAAVNGYAEPGEDIRIVAVVTDNDDAKRNLEIFRESLGDICRERGCSAGVEAVTVPQDDRVAVHIATFQKLIDLVEDNDELFACMTFGTKPLAQAMLLAVQYAYRVKDNARISCIVYGQIDRSQEKPQANIYDMTALVQLDEIVHLLAQRGVQDPKATIDMLMSL